MQVIMCIETNDDPVRWLYNIGFSNRGGKNTIVYILPLQIIAATRFSSDCTCDVLDVNESIMFLLSRVCHTDIWKREPSQSRT